MSPRLRTFAACLAATLAAAPAFALLTPPAAPAAADVGRWLAPFDGEVPAVNMAVLPDGRVLYYSGVEADGSDDVTEATFFTSTPMKSLVRIWDPRTGVVSTPSPEDGGGGDLFCSGTTIGPDGRVLAAGGSEWYTLPDTGLPVKGVKDTRFFDADADEWSDGPSMAVRRWYPSVITLPDGRALVASGLKNLSDPSTHNSLVEVLDDGTWVTLGTAPLAFGDREFAPMNLPMYPRLHVVSGGPMKGDVFYSTAGTLWGPFGERPEEAAWSLQQRLDVESGAWELLGPSVFGARQHAAVVPLLVSAENEYAPRFLTFGGTLQRSVVATPLAEMADLSTQPPTNVAVDPLHHARWHLNGVLAPDGSVFAIGGAMYDNVVVHGQQDPGVLPAERFDPTTGEWTVMASMNLPRGYHSTAVLLPDGRILAGGHVPLPNPFVPARDTVNPQIAETRLEVFEPPYLFLDDASSRPTVALAAGEDAEIGYGAGLTIEAARLEKGLHSVVLMRPAATTHAFDADQRGIVLEASFDGDKVTVTMPPDGDVAPPGWYMLFVNEDVGGQAFPSEALFVRLG